MNNSTSKITAPTLTSWHKKQAAMLYHFASLEYLKSLHRMVSSVIDDVIDPMLFSAKEEKRDSFLVDERWGSRNTAENWSNNAWPFLKDFQSSLCKDIAQRAVERYEKTGVNDCFRGISEYSMQWATVDEEQYFLGVAQNISEYAIMIDKTLDDYQDSRWTDLGFTNVFQKFSLQHENTPRFQIRTDVTGESGRTPNRTGVYVSQDDPNAALQVAWTGNGGGKLRPSKTFSDIGLDALKEVGRDDLWLDDQKMFEFATKNQYIELFRPTIYMLGKENRDLSTLAVSYEAFIDRPCKWYFVEMINGEMENIGNSTTLDDALQFESRINGGERCKNAGYYFTPARPGLRQWFATGEIVPAYESQYGNTIWQWDTKQD